MTVLAAGGATAGRVTAGGPDGGQLGFELPEELIATAPPEARGIGRDQVRLLVAGGSGLTETAFRQLPAFLEPGDLLVVNVSATLPAALPVLATVAPAGPDRDAGERRIGAHRADERRAGEHQAGEWLLHLSTRLPGGLWLVEPRRAAGDGSLPLPGGGRSGELLLLAGGTVARLLGPWPAGADEAAARLWVAALDVPSRRRDGAPSGAPSGAGGLTAGTHDARDPHDLRDLHDLLARYGRPIRYGEWPGAWPLDSYQTVFATEPGSAEMPSAGRAFTPELITALVAKGVGVTPLVLHTGVSSQEAGEPPYPEWYRVGPETAARVNATKAAGGRVIAVGTTVTRALETVAAPNGTASAGEGWTELVLGPTRGARLVDGLITGWHEPRASHLELLVAVAGRELVASAYRAALERGFLWHHFGDLALLLP